MLYGAIKVIKKDMEILLWEKQVPPLVYRKRRNLALVSDVVSWYEAYAALPHTNLMCEHTRSQIYD